MTAPILIIDDEPGVRDSLRVVLEYEGYDIVEAASGREGLDRMNRTQPDLVFLGIRIRPSGVTTTIESGQMTPFSDFTVRKNVSLCSGAYLNARPSASSERRNRTNRWQSPQLPS